MVVKFLLGQGRDWKGEAELCWMANYNSGQKNGRGKREWEGVTKVGFGNA